MARGIHASFEEIKELIHSSVSASYCPIGNPTSREVRLMWIMNSTDKSIYLSCDGAKDHMRIGPDTTQCIDFCSNQAQSEGFFLPIGTQFYAKKTEEGDPTRGSIAIQMIYSM